MLVRALTRRRVSAGVLTLRCAIACAAVTSLSDILSRVTVRQPSLCIDRRYAVACWLALPLVLAGTVHRGRFAGVKETNVPSERLRIFPRW